MDIPQTIRDVQVDRIITVIRQLSWTMIARQDDDDVTRLTLRQDTTGMTKELARAEANRLVRIIEPMGWDDEQVVYNPNHTIITIIHEAPEIEEHPLEGPPTTP